MELSLTIDQGNTAVKMALFDGHKLLKSWRMEQLTEESIDLTLRDFPVAKAIYSSVAGCDCRQLTHLQRKLQRLYVLDRKLPMPLTIDYASPDTLGHDRIAAAVGALELIPGRNLLVVDAGTAVTYDFVTADRHFKGGNIAPGLALRLQALARFCARLPQVESNGETPLIGCDTPTAIRSGAVRGIVAGSILHGKVAQAGIRQPVGSAYRRRQPADCPAARNGRCFRQQRFGSNWIKQNIGIQ